MQTTNPKDRPIARRNTNEQSMSEKEHQRTNHEQEENPKGKQRARRTPVGNQ